MADINRFKSREDAQQYLDSTNQTGTIRNAQLIDQFGRSYVIDNLQQNVKVKVEPPVRQGIGGTEGIGGEPKAEEPHRLFSESDNVVITGNRVDSASYLTKEEAEKDYDALKKLDTEAYISKEGNMYVIRIGSPVKEGVKLKNKPVEFDNKEAALLWYKMLTDRGAKVNPPELTPEGKYQVANAKGYLYATKELAEAKLKDLKKTGYKGEIEPTEEGYYRIKKSQQNEFETRQEADAYIRKMANRNIKLKVVGTEEGKFEAVKMSPTEFSDYAQAQAYQKKILAGGQKVRSRTVTTAEGTVNVVKLGDNEFASRADAVQRQRELEKRGMVSDRDIKFDAASGTYSLSGIKAATKPVTSGTIEKGIEATHQTRVWAAPKIAEKQAKVEASREKRIAQGQRLQERNKDQGQFDRITNKVIAQKQLTPEEEQFRVNNKEAVKKVLIYKQQTGYKPETRMQAAKRKLTAAVGAVEERTSPTVAKVQQAGIKTVETGGQVAAGGIATTVAVQQAVVPTVTKLGKAAIQEFAPTRKLMRVPEKMAEQNLPSVPQGQENRTAFGRHGDRHYKITEDLGGVPKIAARSVSKGSNVGQGTPRIADVGTATEAPGEKMLMTNMKVNMQPMRTSGNLDFSSVPTRNNRNDEKKNEEG